MVHFLAFHPQGHFERIFQELSKKLSFALIWFSKLKIWLVRVVYYKDLGFFSKFKKLHEQANPNFSISLDSMINLAMKYEKSIFELMIDQTFPLVNFDFDRFWPKWPFCPFWSIETLPLKIELQSFNHRCSISYRSPWNQIWIKKLKNSWLNSKP